MVRCRLPVSAIDELHHRRPKHYHHLWGVRNCATVDHAHIQISLARAYPEVYSGLEAVSGRVGHKHPRGILGRNRRFEKGSHE